jgi:predicted SnoaL-like aldol condensation-catalyzing enzyme
VTTTPEENKALVRRFIEALRTGDVAGAAACFDPERYCSHAWGGDLATTWERMKARRRDGTFRDWESESIVYVADGDRVVHHSHVQVTDAATGKRADIHTLEIWRVEDGLIVEHWGGLREYERFREQLD